MENNSIPTRTRGPVSTLSNLESEDCAGHMAKELHFWIARVVWHLLERYRVPVTLPVSLEMEPI